MAEESFQERTEKATPRRRQEMRKKGHVARSVEVNSVFILLLGLICLHLLGPLVYRQLAELSIKTFSESYKVTLGEENLHTYFLSWTVQFLKIVAPFLSIIALVGLLSNFIQVGILLTGEPLVPKLDRLNPFSGFKRLVSKRTLEELFKGVIKIIIVGYISYVTVKGKASNYLPLADQSAWEIFLFAGRMAFHVGLRISLALIFLAILDYAFQRWDYEKSIRMTRQEVKEELKEVEGDPVIRSRVRSVQREMARRRMMQQVPKADVIITNPTHLAIALRYDIETMAAPVVVAKGERLIAEKIVAIAREFGVPIVEDRPLAEVLFKSVEVGMEIPVNLYKAVAEILAYVFRLKRGKQG